MGRIKWPWAEIEKDILANMRDLQVGHKWGINPSTISNHRKHKMGMELHEMQEHAEDVGKAEKNLHFSMTRDQIAERNMKIMAHYLGRHHFEIWKSQQGPTSDWRAFVGR